MTKNTTITKQSLELLHKKQNKTLKDIHGALNLTQHINNYVRNTNKKYGINKTETQPIDDEEANIIIINTLGKLRLHREQATYLRIMAEAGTADTRNMVVLDKARTYAEKANLADAVVKMASLVSDMNISSWAQNIEIIDKLLEERNVINREYFSPDKKLDRHL